MIARFVRAPVVSVAVLALVAGAGSALSQEGQAANPFTLVANAERCFARAATEDGILLLWDALDGFAARPRSLITLADRYVAVGQVRAAGRLVELAAALDPETCGDRLAVARQAAAAWLQEHPR